MLITGCVSVGKKLQVIVGLFKLLKNDLFELIKFLVGISCLCFLL